MKHKPSNQHRQSNNKKPTTFMVKEKDELLPFLLEALVNKGRNSVKSILTRGQVIVDGQSITKHDFPLKPGQQVTINWVAPPTSKDLKGIKILFEDDDLIVIEKDSGVLSMSTGKGPEQTAYRQLTEYVRQMNPKNRIFIVHRLDKDTSGVMMFAKSEKVQQLLQETWKKSIKERKYVALVEGKLEKDEGTMTSYLKEAKTHLMYSSPDSKGGKIATTHYKVMQTNGKYSMLEVQLETGRKNQIRVHMKDIGHPIVGDKKYGSKDNVIGRLGLHAQVLAFKHPMTQKGLTFESKIPKVFFNALNK